MQYLKNILNSNPLKPKDVCCVQILANEIHQVVYNLETNCLLITVTTNRFPNHFSGYSSMQ